MRTDLRDPSVEHLVSDLIFKLGMANDRITALSKRIEQLESACMNCRVPGIYPVSRTM